jgi:hypothetical protein
VLLQNAVGAEHLVATQAGLTLMSPLVATTGGIALFDGRPRPGSVSPEQFQRRCTDVRGHQHANTASTAVSDAQV